MRKIINENDLKKANNAQKCKLILEIIKRTSYLYTRYKNIWRDMENIKSVFLNC